MANVVDGVIINNYQVTFDNQIDLDDSETSEILEQLTAYLEDEVVETMDIGLGEEIHFLFHEIKLDDEYIEINFALKRIA